MFRNVVFDLGNVLLSFKPEEFLKNKNYNENFRKTIHTDIFCSQEWKMIDDGAITVSEAIESISLQSSLKREEIAHIFNLRTEIMFPLGLNIKMLPELKKAGLNLYYLSNFPLDIFEEIRNRNSFFKYFNGGIISAEVKLSKPDPGIYKVLIEKYSLIPGECLFIDDIEENVKSAKVIGMEGFHTSGSPDIFSEVYSKLGFRST